ncbi:MAG: TIGR00282 family metallophosphoesterase [Candidatus Omnitrophica bacterium]|nr:TIGR00282 family metallophosphoesterase [Candidatus Omnitrophota bacterium]MBU1929009.1 TIGR00282 family metallophosphoesterase [Candidatus Omnitrophota bacterium]MBU2035675.1 TIGR00282 family metallophosphoesterase [Candidatus Omnitrophota bacterium]MBU2221092.1 TIGR00282 family metallophosphoesterase [Candidatus Omnitrophota bacterium]MBU2258683.1 TIGR00282 family metallophosphoesterase [Candidatus Omnitrophota bacterium]
MKILFIGDIVGKPGREAVKKLLPGLRNELGLDFVIANAENAAGGSGITAKVAQELLGSPINVITSGDHIWKKQEIFEVLAGNQRILRPLNYPEGAPGSGFGLFGAGQDIKVGVVNVLGRVFLEPLECPFKTVIPAIEALSKETKIIIVDIHAEATSEKVALGWYLDGRVSAVVGTHTHIQTADERILPKGTAYITDVGMVGPYDSVIGRKVEDVLARFVTCLPMRFEVAEGNVQLHGVALDIDEKTGKARSIIRIQRKLDA